MVSGTESQRAVGSAAFVAEYAAWRGRPRNARTVTQNQELER